MRNSEKRPYYLLMLGGTTSIIGTQITAVALPLLLISHVTDNAFLLSLVAASRYIPFIAVSLFAGGVADKHPPLRIMAACDATRIAVVAAIPLLYFFGVLDILTAVVLVLLTATCRVFFDLSSAKLMVTRFHPDSWLRVNAGLDTASNTGELLGPSAAGAIATSIGAAWALVLDSFTYLVSLLTIFALRRSPRPDEAAKEAQIGASGEQDSPKFSALSSARLVWRNKPLRFLLAGTSLQNLALMTAQGVSLLYLVAHKNLGGLGAGIVISALGVGSVCGAAASPALAHRVGLLRAVALVAPLTALGPLSLLLGNSRAVAIIFGAAGYAVLGAAISVSSALSRRYRQGIVKPNIFGRVSGVYGACLMGMLPLGSLLGGAVGDLVNLPAVMVLSAVLFVIAAVLITVAIQVSSSSSTSSSPSP